MSLIIIILWFWKKINKFWGAKHVLSGEKCDFSEVDFQIFENIEISYVFSYKLLLPWCSAPSYHHHRWSQKSNVKYFCSSDQTYWFLSLDSGFDLRFGLKRRDLYICWRNEFLLCKSMRLFAAVVVWKCQRLGNEIERSWCEWAAETGGETEIQSEIEFDEWDYHLLTWRVSLKPQASSLKSKLFKSRAQVSSARLKLKPQASRLRLSLRLGLSLSLGQPQHQPQSESRPQLQRLPSVQPSSTLLPDFKFSKMWGSLWLWKNVWTFLHF